MKIRFASLTTGFALLTSVTLPLVACTSFDDDEKSAAEAVVREHLKDSSAARFTNELVFAARNKDGTISRVTVCGWVNSKNSVGAYSGPTRFVAQTTAGTNNFSYVYIEEEEGPKNFHELYWSRMCAVAKQTGQVAI